MTSLLKSLPDFPRSAPLSLEHKPVFDEALRRDPPVISEYTFTNLYCWRNAYKFAVGRLDDSLVVSSAVKGETWYYYPLGGKDMKSAAAGIVREGYGRLARVPEQIAGVLAGDRRFIVKHDPDNDDYVYRIDDLIRLAGRKYDGKRSFIRKFKSEYKYEYIDLDHSHVRQCLSFKEKWCLLKDCDSLESLRNEKEAVREMIAQCGELGLIGGALMVEGDMAALAIAELLNPETLVLHVLKAHAHMTGVYQVMLNEFLARRGTAFTYVNMEQDLGVPGLRKSKQSYYPALMVKKFIVSKNEQDSR